MRKTNKKGFTIVELVIVIAVVAILAAVLIPTFVSVTKRANESKDTQLVRNLNTALAVDTEVGKHETMQSALEAAAKAGYDVAKINTSATDNEILWDSKNDCFVYKKDSGIEYIPNSVSEEQQKAVKNYQYWIIASAPDATYSTYLYNYKGSGTETVTTGLDVGNETVAAITYKNDTANAQEVVIRTNSFDTTVNVNADNDTVSHHGKVKEVNVAKVAMSSYHEYGEVLGNINVTKGNIEIEKGASVANIVIKETLNIDNNVVNVEAGKVKITVKAESKVNTVQSESNVVKAESVTVGDGAKEVPTIEKEDVNVVYIGKTGYTSFNKAMAVAKSLSVSTITLTKNCTETYGLYALTNGSKTTIDLNGHELTYVPTIKNNTMFATYNRANLLIKNGKITANNFDDGTRALLCSETYSSIYVYNVEINTNGSAFYPKGDAAEIAIESSKINAGVYAVATNAEKVDNYGVKISVKNSELSTKGYKDNDGDACTLLINVSGTLNVDDSVIYGRRTGVLVRAGVANIKNTTISADLSYAKGIDLYLDREWSGGNEVPEYPLVVGDTNSVSYNANAVCTLINVKIVNTSASNKDRFIYMANDGSQYTTELNYDSDSIGTAYVIRKSSKTYVNGIEKVGE